MANGKMAKKKVKMVGIRRVKQISGVFYPYFTVGL